MLPLIIIIIGTILIFINGRAIYREKPITFTSSLEISQGDMSELDFKLGELRREFSETILELQKEVEAIKDDKTSPMEEEATQNYYKTEEVAKLLKDGLSIDEIAERLNTSKGELLLIRELYLK